MEEPLTLAKEFIRKFEQVDDRYTSEIEQIIGSNKIERVAGSGKAILVILKGPQIPMTYLAKLIQKGFRIDSVGVMGSGKDRGKLFISMVR